MHRIDQDKSVNYAAFSNDPLDIWSDATNLIAFIGVNPQFFDVGCCYAFDKGAHRRGVQATVVEG